MFPFVKLWTILLGSLYSMSSYCFHGFNWDCYYFCFFFFHIRKTLVDLHACRFTCHNHACLMVSIHNIFLGLVSLYIILVVWAWLLLTGIQLPFLHRMWCCPLLLIQLKFLERYVIFNKQHWKPLHILLSCLFLTAGCFSSPCFQLCFSCIWPLGSRDCWCFCSLCCGATSW